MMRIFLLAVAISGCDMIMKSDVKQIPDAFEIEQTIYIHGRFPDCYSSVSKVTEKSNQAFLKNKDAFRYSEYMDRQHRAWEPTPVPAILMNNEELEGIVSSRTIDSGVHCFRKTPHFAKNYRKIYANSLTQKGAYYTFSENNHRTFMLYIPSERLLIHTIR